MVQSVFFADANRDDDACYCPGTVVHASGAHPNRSHFWVKIALASRACFGKLQTNTRKNTREAYGQRKRQSEKDIRLDGK